MDPTQPSEQYGGGFFLFYTIGEIVCSPGNGDLADWRSVFPKGSYAGFYFLSPELLGEIVQTLHDLKIDDIVLEANPLRKGGLGVYIYCLLLFLRF